MKKPDKRIQRTHRALVKAFGDLVLERGYDNLTVGHITQRALVARSTFYEHFDCKDDVLRQSVAHLLAVLADTITPTHAPMRLAMVMEHFWAHRHRALPMFSGAARRPMLQVLAELIEKHLAAMRRSARGVKPLLPLNVLAEQIAQSQLTLIDMWLNGKMQSSPDAIAHVLCASTNAFAYALLGQGRPAPRTP